MSLMSKLKKNSRIKDTEILTDSHVFNDKDMTPTDVPMINVALSGKVDGGLTPGLTIFAGPSRHFKTSFALLTAAAYLKQHEDAVMLFYDSEFGSPQAYFETFGIDTDRVLHTPIMNVEELKFDIMSQLENIEKNDKVIIVIDSLGNLASKKEVDDAINEKSVADMTRAKQLKSLFRMVTPHLAMKNISILAINHTIQTMEMFSKQVMTGGTGILYSANQVFFIGRRTTKDGKEVTGYDFVINVEKSRFVKEKSIIPISVSWDDGIEKYSGLFDLGLALGYIHKSGSRYQLTDFVTGEIGENKIWRKDLLVDTKYWDALLQHEPFKEAIKKQYTIGYKSEVDSVLEEDIVVQDGQEVV